jgi:hypothetical protein
MIATLLGTITSVWPSGSALATASMPIMPPAPVRFSTTQGWPSDCGKRSHRWRAMRSAAPPAA